MNDRRDNAHHSGSPASERLLVSSRTLFRIFLILLFVGGACAAVGWFKFMPRGFPFPHPRFWVNTVLPPSLAVFFTVGAIALVEKKDSAPRCLSVFIGISIVVAGITGRCLFPESLSGILLLLALFSGLFGIMLPVTAFRYLTGGRASLLAVAPFAAAGVALGILLPWSQRGAEPGTRPHLSLMPPIETALDDGGMPVDLSDRVRVGLSAGSVSFDLTGGAVSLYPLLTFDSCSPDRFWTIFAPREAQSPPVRQVVGTRLDRGRVLVVYSDAGRSALQVDASAPDGSVRIEALSQLDSPVYSHLNTFTEIHLSGIEKPALSFSPCPGAVEITRSDYPFDRPARLAFIDAENAFRVVEADSAEKGPFTTLAEGVLPPGEALTIEVLSDNNVVCRIILEDWAGQSSRQLSPTAGWGLPENAIEFSLAGGDGSGEAAIFVTLAGTSVGRGWDSVGHAAGCYRNRIRITP